MKQTQGRRLIAILKRRALTYAEMQQLWISTSPQKRVKESLLPGEAVVKSYKGNFITWRVVKCAPPSEATSTQADRR